MSPDDLAAALWSSLLSFTQHEMGVGEGALGNVTKAALAWTHLFSLLVSSRKCPNARSQLLHQWTHSSQPSENILDPLTQDQKKPFSCTVHNHFKRPTLEDTSILSFYSLLRIPLLLSVTILLFLISLLHTISSFILHISRPWNTLPCYFHIF